MGCVMETLVAIRIGNADNKIFSFPTKEDGEWFIDELKKNYTDIQYCIGQEIEEKSEDIKSD